MRANVNFPIRAGSWDLISAAMLALSLAACGKGGSDFSSLAADNGASTVPCTIDATSPEAPTAKVAAADGTTSLFSITPSSSSCRVFYFVNGVRLNSTSSITAEINSSLLNAGSNTIRVEAVNDLGSDSFEWTVSKNTPPICSRAIPVASSLNLSSSGSQAFTGNATTEAGETLSFSWQLDGASNSALAETISGASASQALLTASSGLVGVRNVTLRVSDGLDVSTCQWQVNVGEDCSLTGKSPNVGAVRLANSGGSGAFSVSANVASCLVNWTLNGVDMPGTSTVQTITSASLLPGSNNLRAEVVSSSGTTTQTWSVIRNSPPSCSQTPAATGSVLAVGGSLALNANLSDANGDSIATNWRQNGSAITTPPVALSGSGSTSTATFSPTSAHIGFNSFELRLDDGFDTSTCSWSVQVLPSCTITSRSPSSSTSTIPNLGSTMNSFVVSPSDGSCNTSWTLNGINLGTNATIVNLLSSAFGSSNTLTATVSNAGSSDSHTWTVTKNTPPTCSSQTPSNLGFNLAVGASQTFVANVTDPNPGQTLAFNWQLNGTSPSATFFSSSDTATSSSGTWTALSGQVGSNMLRVGVSDGFDSVTCSWPVDVLRNCAVTSANPMGASLRVGFAPSTSTNFGVVANDPSCAIVWRLNGTQVAMDQNFRNFLSSEFSDSSVDTVSATLTNAVGSTTRNWSVSKNSRPVCASQTPAATGNSINIGSSQVFAATATDSDNDTLAYSWTFNGGTGSYFTSISNATFSSNATFTPGLGQVGNNHTIALTMNDSFDSTTCTWTLDVVDPNSAQVVSWTPTVDPAVILSNGSQTFTVSATGTGLTYAWYLNNVLQASKTSSAETFSHSDMPVGMHTIRVVVRDIYNMTDEHTFNVKRNAAPTKNTISPNLADVSTYRVGVNSTLGFSLIATDANGDSLSYTWRLDGAANAALSSTAPFTSATLGPNGNSLLLGPRVVTVTISDGHESIQHSWNVMVNMFSEECNELYNSSPTGPNGGRVCTLVGNPSMGHSQEIRTDPTLLKARPYKIIELETNVFAFTDHLNHSVVVYNANSGGASVSYFGQTIQARTARVVLGNGAPGRNSDASSQSPAFQTVGVAPNQVSVPIFKLNEPRGLAYDSVRKILYIADRFNRRVIALNDSGNVYRVLGLTAAGNTQNATTNPLTESFGFEQVCLEPTGLAISGRYLYVTCWAQHAIKRVNIDDPGNAATYTLTATVVGRQNGSFVNGVSPIGGISPDGLADPSPNVSTGGVAYANNVLGLAADEAGLVYWLERGGGNQGLRLRALNTSGSTITFYGPTPNSDHVSLSGVFSIQGFDLSGSTFGSASQQANIVNAVAGTLNTLGLAFNGTVGQNRCHLVNVRLLNGTTSIIQGTNTVATLSLTAGSGGFFSDAGCSSALSSNQLIVPAGQTQASAYLRITSAGAFTVQAVAGAVNVSAVGTSVAVSSSGTNTIRVTAPPRFRPNECIPVELGLANGTNPTTIAAGRVIAPTTNNYGSFYSDPSCSSRIDRVAFGASDSARVVYFNRSVEIPNGWVGSLAGYNNSGPASINEYSNGVRIGQTRFENGVTDLSILPNGSTGLPDLIFYSNQTEHYVSAINFTGSDPGLPVTLPAQSTTIVAGQLNGGLNDVNSGYNGEDQAAFGTRFNQPAGVSVNLAGNGVLFGDYLNNRGRTYEVDSTGFIRSSIGAGRARDRAGVTVVDPTQTALVNPYKLEFFSGSLYFSESGNNRIRRTNLSSGTTDVVAGNGSTGTPTEGNDAIADAMNTPRGFKVIAFPNSATPTNFVLVYAENCQVRAVNLSGPTISNFFGAGNLLPGKVRTLAGDTTFGCATWGSFNSDGMMGTAARLNGPEDVAYIDGEIYIINSTDHCILRLATDGRLYRPQGPSSCNTTAPTTNDATLDLMRTRFPRSFAADVARAGNYFLIDQYSDVTGFIRYMNTLTSLVTFKNTAPIQVPARASTSAPIPVRQVYQYSATAGASGLGGVATWVQTTGSSGPNDRVCWTAGVLNDGSLGAHAVFCANRNQDDDGVLAVGPSSGSGLRGGAPLDREQEKISRLNATFYSPYGIAFDDEGNLYISEFNNHIIRMVRRWW